MKKTLNVGFVDTFDGVPQFFMNELSNLPEYEFIRDDENPDILFYGDANFGTRNRQEKYFRDNLVRIFYTGENVRPQGQQAHYAITFDHLDIDQHFRMPLWVLNIHYLQTRIFPGEPISRRYQVPFKDKKFCGFVQANPHCDKRNQLFDIISRYQVIDSAGPWKNNVGFILPRGEDGVLKKMEWLSDYKFSLAAENSQHPGYCTEKILEAYLAGTIPIYWGSPTVSMDFNPKAFVNWHDFKDDGKFLEWIKMINENKDLYDAIYNEPLIDQTRFEAYDRIHLHLFDFLEKIVKRHF